MTRRIRLRLFVAWLVVALVGAQLAGFGHAIAHAKHLAAIGVDASALVASAATGARSDEPRNASLEHSCAAFDAATLAAFATPTLPVVPYDDAVASPAVTPSARDVPSLLALGYRSRAPPIVFSA